MPREKKSRTLVWRPAEEQPTRGSEVPLRGSGGALLGQKAAQTKASDLPTRNVIPCQHWRQHQIYHIRFGGAETAWGGNNRDVILIAEQQKIAGLYGSKEAFDLATGAQHRAPDDIVRTRRRCGGSDQNRGGTALQQMLQRSRYGAFFLERSQYKCRAGTHPLQPLPHNVFEQLPGAF